MNCGAYSHVNPRFQRVLGQLNYKDQNFDCISRRSVASIAVGFGKRNKEEEESLLTTLDQYISMYVS